MSPVSNPGVIQVTIDQKVIASGTIRNSNDTDRSTALTAYTKLKEIQLNQSLIAATICFTIGATPIETDHYGKLYKNNAPLGAEHTQSNCGATAYQDNIAAGVSGDKYQIYAYTNVGAASPVHINTMKVCYGADDDITHIGGTALATPLETTDTRNPTISITNQDP